MYHSLLLVLLYSWCANIPTSISTMPNYVSPLRSLDINIPAYSSGRDQTLITSSSSTMSDLVSALCSLDINIAAYSLGQDQTVIVYDGDDGFVEALDSMADECNLHLYRGVLYNMPYKVLASPPYYCVSLGPYIGVFTLYLWYVCYHMLPKTLLILY
jgi:hypothetical protein